MTGGANKVVWKPRGPPHPPPAHLAWGPGRFSHRRQLLGSWGLPGLAAAASSATGHGPTPSAPWEGQGHSSSPPLSASPPAPTPTPPRGAVLAPRTLLRTLKSSAPARATAWVPTLTWRSPTEHLICTYARERAVTHRHTAVKAQPQHGIRPMTAALRSQPLGHSYIKL